ncbi:efflux transporter periplasmic adaptor subunit [Chitinophaga caeni]|uniref:Efflux transporter periplasmic adaptor subunit n=1 Tax=Chitinophaga caeni TaxID=2029983 RepID=A0A291QSC4_9BACT|nr:efflux RND transporter periplasmic adaptor subunit [Chitinophaga caeni]ATL46836.1 efflux transporter periplasmic adaptor subunit [Chitinophaga caeni]
MRKKLIWIIPLSLLVLFILYSVLVPKDNSIKVAVDKAETKNIIEVVSVTGKIYPETEVKVSPDVSGEIVDLYVQEGDSVTKGQPLARIYADIYGSVRDKAVAALSQSEAQLANTNAALNSFKAKLTQAKAAYDRNKTLLDQKVISRSEFETVEATYRSAEADYKAAQQQIESNRFAVASAQANLTEANKNLSRTTINAPMGGIISLLPVKKGERVVGTGQMAGTEMMRIADMSVMEVQVDVGENDIPKIKYGDTALIEVDAYNNRKFKGIVTQIASSSKDLASSTSTTSSADQVTNYIVHVRVLPSSYEDLLDPKNSRSWPLRPGMSANVDIQTKRVHDVLAVPINSVTTRSLSDSLKANKKADASMAPKADSDEPQKAKDDKEVVFVIQADNTVKAVPVVTGIQDDNFIEIKTGLKAGDQVVSAPYPAISRTLQSGSKIKVVPKDQLFEPTK